MITDQELAEELSGYPREKLDIFKERAVDAKYPGTVVNSFISSRVLNFWAEENELLDKADQKGWRKFSFTELAWLKIIYDLRQFGVSFKILKKLKNNLLYVPEIADLKKFVKENREKIHAVLQTVKSSQERKAVLLLLKVDKINGIEISSNLLTYLLWSVFFRTHIYLLVNAEGEHICMAEKHRDTMLKHEHVLNFIRKPYVSISLTEIVEHFILKEKIDPGITESIYTADELRIIDIIRKERPESLIVKFNKDNKIDLVEVVKSKKADLSYRLSDIILKNGYETITIKTQAGKIVSCKNTIKRKP